MSINRSMIADECRRIIDVPFCHQGRSEEQGLDCIGSVLLVFTRCGWEPLSPETTLRTDYDRFPDGEMLVRSLTKEVDECGIEDADLFLLKYKIDPQHVGIIIKGDSGMYQMCHSLYDKGVVMHVMDKSWERRMIGYYRLK